jgi:hypothetical protein
MDDVGQLVGLCSGRSRISALPELWLLHFEQPRANATEAPETEMQFRKVFGSRS